MLYPSNIQYKFYVIVKDGDGNVGIDATFANIDSSCVEDMLQDYFKNAIDKVILLL